MIKTPDFRSRQTVHSHAHKSPICRRQLRPLHRALQDSDLVPQGENLQLERSTASKRAGK
jgi:hypothetical protein